MVTIRTQTYSMNVVINVICQVRLGTNTVLYQVCVAMEGVDKHACNEPDKCYRRNYVVLVIDTPLDINFFVSK